MYYQHKMNIYNLLTFYTYILHIGLLLI